MGMRRRAAAWGLSGWARDKGRWGGGCGDGDGLVAVEVKTIRVGAVGVGVGWGRLEWRPSGWRRSW